MPEIKSYVYIPEALLNNLVGLERVMGLYLQANNRIPILPKTLIDNSEYDMLFADGQDTIEREKSLIDSCDEFWICFAVGTDPQDEECKELMKRACEKKKRIVIMSRQEIESLVEAVNKENSELLN